MRQSLLRRVVAALFIVVGIGAVSGVASAQVAPTHGRVTTPTPADWQW